MILFITFAHSNLKICFIRRKYKLLKNDFIRTRGLILAKIYEQIKNDTLRLRFENWLRKTGFKPLSEERQHVFKPRNHKQLDQLMMIKTFTGSPECL